MNKLIIRYRKGTLFYVKLNVIEQLAKNLDLIFSDRGSRRGKVQQIQDGAGWGIAIDATWPQMLSEFIEEFEKYSDNRDQSWRPVVAEFIKLVSQEKPSDTLWLEAKAFLHQNLNTFSGWNWSSRRCISIFQKIYRRDGKYYFKDGDEEIECLGVRTANEERVDHVAESATWKYGLLHSALKILTLTNIERLSCSSQVAFPNSARIEMNESDQCTWFLHWRWTVKWPYQMRPINWRPDSNLCDPDWLANDLIIFISEIEKLDAGPEHLTASPDLAIRWHKKFGSTARQTSFALTSNLRIGDEGEAWLEFRGHTYRWINQTPSSYPALVVTHLPGETERDVTLRTFKLLSHVTFVHDQGIEISFWSGSQSRLQPGVSNPKRNTTIQYPDSYFKEVPGTNPDILDFALSLYREGISSESKFYSFLNFYKIIQKLFNENGTKITAWLETNAPQMSAFKESYFQADLQSSGQAVADYLRNSNRNAIAHVNLRSGQTVIDPDDIDHHRRVSNSVNVVKELAQFAIKQKLF